MGSPLRPRTPTQVKPLTEYAHDFLASVPGLSYRLEALVDGENEYHLVLSVKLSDVSHFDESVDDYPTIEVVLNSGTALHIEGSTHTSLTVQVNGEWREFDRENYELSLMGLSIMGGELSITLYARELRCEFTVKVVSSNVSRTAYFIHVSNDYDRYDVAIRLVGHTWVVEVDGVGYARGKSLEEALETAISKWNIEHGGIPNPFLAVKSALMREEVVNA